MSTRTKPAPIIRGAFTIEPVRVRQARDRRRKRDAFQLTDSDGNFWDYHTPATLPEALALADRLTVDKELLGRSSKALGRDDEDLRELITMHAENVAKYPAGEFRIWSCGLPEDCAELYRLRHGHDFVPDDAPAAPLPKVGRVPVPRVTPGALF